MPKLNNESAWQVLLQNDPTILRDIARTGTRLITADEIRKFREPRLMAKFDSSAEVPSSLGSNKINILPISRKQYVLGDFNLFEKLPPTRDEKPRVFTLPDLETLRVEDISSESNAINALKISGILEDFLGEKNVLETFNGKMGTGGFGFEITRHSGHRHHIDVDRAQLEIDGGFESKSSVTILEAKNVPLADFNVRQLYYPFRKYHQQVRKPIRLVYSEYTNLAYRLFEYEFQDVNDFSSISLVKSGFYSIDSSRVSWQEFVRMVSEATPSINDGTGRVPFPQADVFDRIIALCEKLSGEPRGLSTDDVASFLGMVNRQAAYYPAAAEYLGLVDRSERGMVKITSTAKDIVSSGHRQRTLRLIELLLEHHIFKLAFERVIQSNGVPSQATIIEMMMELNVLGSRATSPTTYARRAKTVVSWLAWTLNQLDDSKVSSR